jgi:HAD superfamily hydrolase (TIGR01509 family)
LWRAIGVKGPAYEAIAGRRTKDVVEEITVDLAPSQAQIQEWVLFKQRQARGYLANEPIAYCDSAPCLEMLAQHNVPLALGTAASRDTTELVLGRLGLIHLFSIIVTAEDVKNGKPSPEIYQRIIAKVAVCPGKTIIVEDSLSGLEAAVRAQAYVASVRTGTRVAAPTFMGSFVNLHELLSEIGFPPSHR